MVGERAGAMVTGGFAPRRVKKTVIFWRVVSTLLMVELPNALPAVICPAQLGWPVMD